MPAGSLSTGKESSMRVSILSVLTAFAIILPSIGSAARLAQENLARRRPRVMELHREWRSQRHPRSRVIPILSAWNGSGRPKRRRTMRSLPRAGISSFPTSAAGASRCLGSGQLRWHVPTARLPVVCLRRWRFCRHGFAGADELAHDGAASDVKLCYADQVSAEYLRYAPDDPLCCPSEYRFRPIHDRRHAGWTGTEPGPAVIGTLRT